jgi:hypothetical protein
MTYISKLTVVAVLSISTGVFVGKGMSSEPTVRAARQAPAYAVPEGAGYLPSQVVNQAKEIEPPPPTF